MKRRELLKTALFLVVFLSEPPRGEAGNCFTPLPGFSAYDIPVYLVWPGPEYPGGYALDVVEHDIRVAIDNWLEDSSADFHPKYMGRVDSRSANWQEIRIIPTLDCTKCASFMCTQVVVSGSSRRADIFIEMRNDGGSSCLSSAVIYPRHDAVTRELNGLLTHELGHAWGLDEDYALNCEGIDYKSAMAQTCPNGRNITRRDSNGVSSIYGARSKPYSAIKSLDGGLTWVSLSADFSPVSHSTRQLSLGTRDNDLTAEAFSRPQFQSLVTRGSDGDTGGYFYSYTPWNSASSYSWDVGGAARYGGSAWAIAYRPYESELACNQKGVVVSSIAATGGTWVTTEARETAGTTYRSDGEGVSLAYDPVEDLYVAAFSSIQGSSSDPAVAIQTFDRATGARVGFKTLPQAFATDDAPVVACNSTAFAGTFNCLLAWRAPTGKDPVKYARINFDRVTGPLNDYVNVSSNPLGAPLIKTHGYWTTKSPSLTANSSSTYPFIIGLRQQETYFTWQYEAATTNFVNQRAPVYVPGGILSATLGRQQSRLIIRYMAL